jgi:hypothetical protein
LFPAIKKIPITIFGNLVIFLFLSTVQGIERKKKHENPREIGLSSA